MGSKKYFEGVAAVLGKTAAPIPFPALKGLASTFLLPMEKNPEKNIQLYVVL